MNVPPPPLIFDLPTLVDVTDHSFIKHIVTRGWVSCVAKDKIIDPHDRHKLIHFAKFCTNNRQIGNR